MYVTHSPSLCTIITPKRVRTNVIQLIKSSQKHTMLEGFIYKNNWFKVLTIL